MTAITESSTLRELLAGWGDIGKLVAEHGQLYRGGRLPKPYRPSTRGMCFRNAYYLAQRHPELQYVEGYVLRYMPVQHAWCVDQDGRVIDPTLRLRADDDVEYMGIPLPLELVDLAILLSGTWGVLDDYRNQYPLLQQPFSIEASIARLKQLLREKGEAD